MFKNVQDCSKMLTNVSDSLFKLKDLKIQPDSAPTLVSFVKDELHLSQFFYA